MLFHFISIIIIYWSSFGTNICSMCLSRAVHVYRWSASSSKIWQLQHLCLWIPVAVKEDDGVSLVEKRKSRKDPEGIWVSEPAGGEPLFGSWIVSSESTVVNCCQMLSNVVNLDLQKTHLLAFQSEAALQRLLPRIFWKADICRPSKAEFQQRPKLIIFWPFKKVQKEPLRETSHPSPVESAVLGSQGCGNLEVESQSTGTSGQPQAWPISPNSKILFGQRDHKGHAGRVLTSHWQSLNHLQWLPSGVLHAREGYCDQKMGLPAQIGRNIKSLKRSAPICTDLHPRISAKFLAASLALLLVWRPQWQGTSAWLAASASCASMFRCSSMFFEDWNWKLNKGNGMPCETDVPFSVWKQQSFGSHSGSAQVLDWTLAELCRRIH